MADPAATWTALIRRYYDGCSAGDVDLMRSTLHPDVVHWFLAPNTGSTAVEGAEHLARYWRKVTGMLQARWIVEHICATDEQAVIEWTMWWLPQGATERVATRGGGVVHRRGRADPRDPVVLPDAARRPPSSTDSPTPSAATRCPAPSAAPSIPLAFDLDRGPCRKPYAARPHRLRRWNVDWRHLDVALKPLGARCRHGRILQEQQLPVRRRERPRRGLPPDDRHRRAAKVQEPRGQPSCHRVGQR